MNFKDGLYETVNAESTYSITENGALGYSTTGKSLLDMNFAVASYRSATEKNVVSAFKKAYAEDKKLAIKWLFYARDVRGGLGERRLFRTIFKHVIAEDESLPTMDLIELIPKYGRIDDVVHLLDTRHIDGIICFLKNQLVEDTECMNRGEGVSLLAKWLPSINTSSTESRQMAGLIAKRMGYSHKEYRKILSALRRYLDVVEVKMSNQEFGEIDYSKVPSKANLLYNKAFLKHDKERREKFLYAVQKGEININAGTIYPHEIVHKYMDGNTAYYKGIHIDDLTLEELWKALPDKTEGMPNSIVVADGSESMLQTIEGTRCTAISVANALAIYMAERSVGQFKDFYITFSNRPQLVDLSEGKSLREKINIALEHNEVANTNIRAVFELILKTAVDKNMSQSELPVNIVVVSDMEFDEGTTGTGITLFEHIKSQYEEAGYKMPRLVFWNVNSRTKTIPVCENEMGVALVSGFSVNILDMVTSGEIDPFKCLLGILNSDRYKAVEDALA